MIPVRNEAICVCDYPLAFRVALGCCIYGRNRDIQAMGQESRFSKKLAQIIAVSATDIESYVVWAGIQQIADSLQVCPRKALFVQAAARCYRGGGISRLSGAPLLRLQEIHVPAACKVEGMPLRTNEAFVFPRQSEAAVAYRANEHVCQRLAETRAMVSSAAFPQPSGRLLFPGDLPA